MTRRYSSVSTETTLANPISDVATTITVATGTGAALMGGISLTAGNVDQFTLAIEPDTIREEIVFVTNISSDTLTVVRNRAGTSNVPHLAGVTVKHVLTSDDLNYFNSGVDGAVTLTGAQTLTNKTLTAPIIATINNGGTVTIPGGAETLVGRVTADTLSNKTLSDAKINFAINANTGTTYTFLLSDASKLVTSSNASAQTLSIPTNATSAFAIGTTINVIQIGTGQVTVSAVSSGTTSILSTAGVAPKARTQYSSMSLLKVGTDTWYAVGDIV